jgi:hypothetical protein
VAGVLCGGNISAADEGDDVVSLQGKLGRENARTKSKDYGKRACTR